MEADEAIDLDIDADIAQIRSALVLSPPPPSPQLPLLNQYESLEEKVRAVQSFIESFQYNYTGKPFFKMIKSKGTAHIYECANSIIDGSLPIQCVEAVFIGLLLTSELHSLVRVPLSFKSKHGNNIHRHIVLALHVNGKWGAIGISRRNVLMDKPFSFSSLDELIREFKNSYEECLHSLMKVYVANPIPHELVPDKPVQWRKVSIRMNEIDSEENQDRLNSFATSIAISSPEVVCGSPNSSHNNASHGNIVNGSNSNIATVSSTTRLPAIILKR